MVVPRGVVTLPVCMSEPLFDGRYEGVVPRVMYGLPDVPSLPVTPEEPGRYVGAVGRAAVPPAGRCAATGAFDLEYDGVDGRADGVDGRA